MFVRFIRRLAHDQRGGTAIEYGLILALVFIAMIAAVVEVANQTTGMWGDINTKVVSASGGPPAP